uniref:Uncharacterized protein n=1 Tax=Physcomitrium patens TaxID=3218 RepID=A0A7I3YYY0_PHYPA
MPQSSQPCPTLSEDNQEFLHTARNTDFVEPELVVAVTSIGKFDKIHPTIPTAGESPSSSYTCSSSGFLLHTEVLPVKVDQEIVKRESAHLQKHAVVSYFVGGKQNSYVLNKWLEAVKEQVGNSIVLGRGLGRGVFSATQHVGSHNATTAYTHVDNLDTEGGMKSPR